MKRRTLQRLRPDKQPEHHHSVYVVLLDPAVGRIRKVRAENPKRDRKKPCLYVGMTAAAEDNNAENLLVIADTDMAAKYAQNWSVHRQHSEPYTGLPASHESQPHRRKFQ